MADNFNMKKFLVENKLGAYSKLKENESSDLEVKWTKKYTKDPDLYYEKGLASEFEMVNGKKVKEIIGYFEDEDEDEDEEVIGYIYSKSNKDIETEYSEEDLDDAFTKALGSMNEGEAAYEYEKGKAAGEKIEKAKLAKEDYAGAEEEKMMDFLAEKPVEEAGQGTLMAVDRIEEIVNNLARNISTNSNIPTQEKLGLVQALKELKDLVEDLGADVEMGMSETKKEEGYMGTQYDSSEDMAVDMVKKGITEASGGLSPLHKQLIQNIVDNYFDGGIYADPAMERIERILNDDLSWEELDNEDLEDLKEESVRMFKSDNPEGDKLVLGFLKRIAKDFNYPVSQAAMFVKERIKKLGY
jgi:hypothetical protein